MNNTTHKLIILTLLAVATIGPRAAQAQDLTTLPKATTTLERVNPVLKDQAHQEALERANRQQKAGGVLVGVSVVSLAGAVPLAMLGGAIGAKGMFAAGVAAGVFGVVGTVAGAVTLRTGKQKKRELERKRVQSEFRIGAGNASLKLAF